MPDPTQDLVKIADDIARDVSTLARLASSGRLSIGGGGIGGGGGGGGIGGGGGGGGRGLGGARGGNFGLAGKIARGGVGGLALGAAAAVGTTAVRAGAAGISASVDGALNLGLNAQQSLTAGLLAGASKIPFVGGLVAKETNVEEAAGQRALGITAKLRRAGATDEEVRPLRELLFERFSGEELRASQEKDEVARLVAQRGNPRSLARFRAGRTFGPDYGPNPSEEIIRATATGRMASYRRGSE